MISAKIIADSINPDAERLTTLELTYPRFIHSEFMTHRTMSRNAASSRAIPVTKIMKQVLRDPSVPIAWGRNQKGMQARIELTGWRRFVASHLFLLARFPALAFAWLLTKVGLHKQITNRILEPWMHITIICSATEFENFFKQRLHPDAQPEFRELARCMSDAMAASTPKKLEWGEWHLPYVDHYAYGEQLNYPKIAASCCARVSYVRQGNRKSDEEDIAFADKLASDRHFSPLEHPAKATRGQWGNFSGFRQLRKFYDGEDGCEVKEEA